MKKLLLALTVITLLSCSEDEEPAPIIFEDTFYQILEGETKVTEFTMQVKPSEVSGNYKLAYEVVNLTYNLETEEHNFESVAVIDTLLVTKDTTLVFQGGLKALTAEPLDSHSGFLQVKANNDIVLDGEALQDRYITFYIPFKY